MPLLDTPIIVSDIKCINKSDTFGAELWMCSLISTHEEYASFLDWEEHTKKKSGVIVNNITLIKTEGSVKSELKKTKESGVFEYDIHFPKHGVCVISKPDKWHIYRHITCEEKS